MQTKMQASHAQNFTPVQTGLLQRQSALCNTPGLVEDSGQDKEKITLQRSSTYQARTTIVPPIVHEVLRSPGQQLAPETRAYVEPRFGYDFSRVWVHAAATPIQAKLTVGQPNDRYEQEADRVADEVMRMPKPQVQRQVEPEEEEEEKLQVKPLVNQITPLVQRQPDPIDEDEEEEMIQAKPLTVQTPEVTPALSSGIQSLQGGGRPLSRSERSFFEPRFGADFSNVRVHNDTQAASVARLVNARAFTLGHNVVFSAGEYSSDTFSNRQLLAHELTHTLQQQDATLPTMIQHSFCDAEVDESADFDSILGQIETCPYYSNLEELTQLVPILIQHAQDQDLYEHGHTIVSLLIGLGLTEQLTALLPRIERVWREVLTSEARTTIPAGNLLWGEGSTPRQLISTARNLAIRGEHAAAVSMLRTAFMILQVIAVYQSNRLGDVLQASYAHSARIRSADLITLTMSYPSLREVYSLMRSVLGMYPALAREHYAAGRRREGDEMRQINTTLWYQIREMGGLLPETDTTRGISMATLRVERPGGGVAYEAWGAQGNRELLNPLPGAPSPDELASTPGLWESMGDIMSNLYEQETWMARLYRHPEVVQEFGSNPIDINNPDQRHRLFRIMYQIFQRNGVGLTPLDGILRFMEEYLQRFTFHTGDYNIRDMGQNYLDTEFPQDLTGRVIRDCGVYAITTAYDVYRLARAENINVRFEIFTMTDHALLLITEEDANAYFVVSNNEIEGPLYGNQIRAIAVAFSESVGRDYVALPSISQPLGSTRDPDRRFRQQIWNRYQNVTRWGLLPEAPAPGETRSEEERSEASYRNYYEAQREFDELATQVDGVINNLRRELQDSENHIEELERYVGPLTTAGRRLAEIFIRYAAEARSAIGEREGANTRTWMLYQLYATPTRGQQHPLVRLARVLLYYQYLGGTLNNYQQILSNWMCTERESAPPGERILRQQEFCNLIERYRQAGFPPDFDIQ